MNHDYKILRAYNRKGTIAWHVALSTDDHEEVCSRYSYPPETCFETKADVYSTTRTTAESVLALVSGMANIQ